jgi:hypothetical protein
MSMMSRIVAAGLVGAAALATAPAMATQIPDGTVSIVGLFNPTVNLGAHPNTFTATTGLTFEISGTGGFSGVSGLTGTLNGTIDFSSVLGATIDQSIANFFTFNDGTGHNYEFSLDSVTTTAYTNTPGVSTGFTLYLLGATGDAVKGYASTPTSLTLVFGNTGTSAYSAAATLAVPPAPIPSVPEPATWALTLVGFGAMGAAMRRRPRVSSVTFA